MLDFSTWTAPRAHLLTVGRYDTLKFTFVFISFILHIFIFRLRITVMFKLNLSTCFRCLFSWDLLGFCSRMQNSVLGNYSDAAAHGKLWNPKNNWEHAIFSPSPGYLHSPFWLTGCHRPSWKPLLSVNQQVTAGWQLSGDGSPFEEREEEETSRRDSSHTVIALALLLVWMDT